jgi:thymidylate synthase ThyX/thymidylate kinase
MNRGKYIVLEGPSGSGKTEQLIILAKKLEAAGFAVKIFTDPDINNDLMSRTIYQNLNNPDYPINAKSRLFLNNAARSQTIEKIYKSLYDGIYCLSDRNYLSTIVEYFYHKKIVDNYSELTSIINLSNHHLEPDLTLVFDAPSQQLSESIDKESDNQNVIDEIRTGYLIEAKKRNIDVIYSVDSSDEIASIVWEKTRICLAQRKDEATNPTSISEILKSHDPVLVTEPITDNQEYLETIDGIKRITENGKRYLESIVTSTEDNVYAFKDTMNPVTIAAAMARLSRRSDDMRITILDEFSNNSGTDTKLLKRVISEYGDDSVQQLSGHHLVVENASNLLTKKIEWGRLAAYLEQSTRYIYYDKKDTKGNYRYFIPKELNPKSKLNYKKQLNSIYKNYSAMSKILNKYISDTSTVPLKERDAAWRTAVKAQVCDVLRNVLPVAAQSTVGIFASAQAIENLIMRLKSDELSEVRITGDKILKNIREVAPVFYERADDPKRGGANIAYRVDSRIDLDNVISKILPKVHSTDLNSVNLIDYYPKNEIDLVPYIVFNQSTLSLGEIKHEVSKWSYKNKEKILDKYMGKRLNRRHKPGRALEMARYTWEIICDYGIFRDLQRHRIVENLVWQDLSPRYGYEIPELIDKAGLIDQYEQCFDISLKLYSDLIRDGHLKEAQYAVLMGHKIRWQVSYNAREAFHIHELRTSPQGHPGYRKLVLEMHDKLSEVHPIIGKSMIFVNTNENPELTRLAAERYKQLKKEKLI